MGLDVYLRNEHDESIQKDSVKHPKSYFKIGYFRSAYNSGGFNSVLQRAIGKDLYYIFEPPKNAGKFKPDWNKAWERCTEVINEFDIFSKRIGNVNVMTISERMYSEDVVLSEKDATDAFIRVRDEETHGFNSFISKDGHFYLDGIKCLAFIPGKNPFGYKCVYVFYELLEDDEKNELGLKGLGTYAFYKQALEIVLETIEYVLNIPTKERKLLKLSWSA